MGKSFKFQVSNFKFTGGFTLVELLIVSGIVLTLITLLLVNLPSFYSRSSITATVDQLIPEIRQQQMKAIQGDTEGRATNDNYGVHFDTNQYVLFHGSNYNPLDTSNVIIKFDSNIIVDQTTLQSNNVLFASVSGEIVNFISGEDTVILKDQNTSLSRELKFNRYGIITQVN